MRRTIWGALLLAVGLGGGSGGDAAAQCTVMPAGICQAPSCVGQPTVGNANFMIDPDPCCCLAGGPRVLIVNLPPPGVGCGPSIVFPPCPGTQIYLGPMFPIGCPNGPVPFPIPNNPSLVGLMICFQTVCTPHALCPFAPSDGLNIQILP